MTPTEELVLEVLVARTRLGESLWTFSSSVTKQLSSLESQGFVHVMHGVTENTIRAALTVQGKTEFMDSRYTPTVNKEYAEKISDWFDEIGYDSNAGNMIRKRFGLLS